MVASTSPARRMGVVVGPGECYLSFLPLAHVAEQFAELLFLTEGGAIGFYQGDTLKIMDDLKALRPTFFVAVPRLYTRCVARLHDSASMVVSLRTDAALIDSQLYKLRSHARVSNTRIIVDAASRLLQTTYLHCGVCIAS